MPIKKTLEALVRNDKSLSIPLGTFADILPTNEEALEHLHNCQTCTTDGEHSHRTTYTIYQQQDCTMSAKVPLCLYKQLLLMLCLVVHKLQHNKYLVQLKNYGCIYLVKIHMHYNLP